ncbi:serine/threonine-protein kinase [Aliivibrio wodanis]|uniref:serine/threonine-protein kinase n=1 Tax=Aliivibrio wodanis TaxID=80852 RepID=UPI00406D4292
MSIYKNHLKRHGFELLEDIGSGLSGKTKKARQYSLERFVAVKFFDSIFNINNEDLRKRFKREAFILAEIQHPSIPYVLTNGEIIDGERTIPYTVMEYIDGSNLEDYIYKNGALKQEQVINIACQILEALALVHSKGIIHRDIKPSNIMLSKSGHAYLIDFSIGFSSLGVKNFTRSTRTGDHLGSAEYMSPEQGQNMKNVDECSDIYSLGFVLCKLLTGVPSILMFDKPEFSVSFTLKKVITKACEYKKEDRYSSASEFLRELQSCSGISQSINNHPSKALCNNQKCSHAEWSENGYYKGAYFIEECTDIHCTACGNKLIYQCVCGYPIANTPYCGGCGEELFKVPECEKCGSYLTKFDMGKSTSEGCKKCKSKVLQLPQQVVQPVWGQQAKVIPQQEFDDDIPF